MPDIRKSTRHQKIIGEYGEHLICNWLSRSGFEVTIVDHTGIDIIAYHPITKKRLGITVKSRTRDPGTEKRSVNILKRKEGMNDRKKLLDACEAFNCEPWIGIYVEISEYADVFLTSLEHYDLKYRKKPQKVIDDWKMTKQYIDQYDDDPNVKHIRFELNILNWRWEGVS
jgi:hypothetical protein